MDELRKDISSSASTRLSFCTWSGHSFTPPQNSTAVSLIADDPHPPPAEKRKNPSDASTSLYHKVAARDGARHPVHLPQFYDLVSSCFFSVTFVCGRGRCDLLPNHSQMVLLERGNTDRMHEPPGRPLEFSQRCHQARGILCTPIIIPSADCSRLGEMHKNLP